MSRSKGFNIVVLIFSFLFILFLIEIGIRVFGETDSQGYFSFAGYRLDPPATPLKRLAQEIDSYFAREHEATIIYNKYTGWAYRPYAKLQVGAFTVNSVGIRSKREYALEPPLGTLRIALFGDSFVASEEVWDDEAWGYKLELLLNQAGIKAEVLNFGVSGFNMGQAYLNWQHRGKLFSPDIVIFGFQPENLDRNVNIFPHFQYPAWIVPFARPRFVLTDGELTLVNYPSLPPDQLLAVNEELESHPLADYEAYHTSRDPFFRMWSFSRLATLFHVALNQNIEQSSDDHGLHSEKGKLAIAIVDAFSKDVQSSGANFIVLHLPGLEHLRNYFERTEASYQPLLHHLLSAFHFIDVLEFLEPKYLERDYFQPGRHYGPEINRRIAEAVAADLLTCIADRTCVSARLQ
ncbi:MAG: SGNH/GDSL hydrolase family protein [Chloroflexi bacterium]|nr:SGNH/GDSL hydrolase family protein [Chloroflexota bacterium]